MFDIGWSELLILGALALIVVGPKDLPRFLRTAGQAVGKMRGMAREFQKTMNDAARDADLADMKELRGLKSDLGSIQSDFRKQVSGVTGMNSSPAKTAPKPEVASSAPAAPVPDPSAPAETAPATTAKTEPAKPETVKPETAKVGADASPARPDEGP